MNNMGVGAALAVFLLFIATVNADAAGGITFWREIVTMTCPEEGTFYDKDKNKVQEGMTHELTYDNNKKIPYHCKYDSDQATYYFYMKGKVCYNCFELNPYLLGLVIIVDVVLTAFMMMIIFKCTKKKSSAGLAHASKPPARSGGRGQPDSSPYEQLNCHTRAQDTYSIVNRTG